MGRPTISIGVLIFLIFAPGVARGQDRPEFKVPRAAAPPKIDGNLTDETWNSDPLVAADNWVSYNPLRGEKAQLRTEVRIAYDDGNLYFAFHSFDDEPRKIRTTIFGPPQGR